VRCVCPVRIVVHGTVYAGRALDLTRASVSVDTLVRALRSDHEVDGVSATCPPPSEAHATLGRVDDENSDSIRTLLAAAARSRGMRAPESEELVAVRRRADAVDVPEFDLSAARQRAAETSDETDRLRERVAALRGRLREREVLGEPTDEINAEFVEAVGRLSEVETERIAARQALERAERRARDARTTRERRLRLEDRAANLERAARKRLAGAVYGEFAAAVRSLPGRAVPGASPREYEGDRVTAHLAAVRVARLSAPVVLAVRRFDSAREAAVRLDAPVVRV
jgi:hypothetical protein